MPLRVLFIVVDSLTRPFGALPAGTVDGYAGTARGQAFSYHSAHPTERASLLVRSLDSTGSARWTTAPVRVGAGETRHLAFLAAMDVADPGQSPVRFWMTVNGAHRFALPQPTSAAPSWRIDGGGGIALSFRRLLIDKFGDVHGVFTLHLPAALAPAGQPVVLEVQGESVGRMSWFILYTVSLQPTLRAQAEQMLVREGDVPYQTVRLDAWNPFDTTTVSVSVDGTPRLSTLLPTGGVTLRVSVPAVRELRTVALTASSARGRTEFPAVPVLPVVRREIHLINHSHLDIGYTDVQPAVEAKHWRGYDSALAYVERSAGNPEGLGFRWNLEGLWPLEGYLGARSSADTARLLAAARRGDVSVSALYANLMTGLLGGEELMKALGFARALREEHGIPMTAAMTSDVPGFTWGLVPALAQHGIRWLSSGPNYIPGPGQDGDRIGHTLRSWGDRPFWWMGPSGRDSVLVMTAGRGYSWIGGWPRGRLTVEDASVMSEYLDELGARDYPWDIVQVRVAIGGDNGVPDGELAEVVRRWNERYLSPRLVISTLPRMFAEMERRHGAALPRIRGDLTGYWEDGAMSSAKEQVMNRAAAARLVQAASLAAIRGASLPAADRRAAWRSVLLWDEHTWGADRSISDPDAPDVVAQWRIKQRFALEADSASRALLARAGRARAAGTGVDLWNTHEFARRGVVFLPDTLSREGDRVREANGRLVPSQRLEDGSLAVQPALRPLGATRLVVGPGAAVGPSGPPARAAGDSLWNGRVVVRIDHVTGALASVRWRGQELVDARKGGWNRYRYLLGRDTSQARDASRPRIERLEDGPLVATLRITAEAPGAVWLAREVTLEAGSDAVRIITRLDKAKVREKEAVHLAFPLAVPGGTVRMEQGLAVVRPDVDQAAGANRHLYPVQRWLDASNADFGITVATPDLGLWQLNGLTAEAFKRSDGREEWLPQSLPGTELIAYAMNNYWHTNFKADQPGPVAFRVVLVPHGPFDAAAATRAGLDASEPPVALPAEAGPARSTLFTLDAPGVVVSSLTPSADGRADMVRLWNPGDRAVRASFRWGPGAARRVAMSSPFEEQGPAGPARIAVPALGSVTVRVER
jgi:hypothetical protein